MEPGTLDLTSSNASHAKLTVRVTNSGTAKVAFEPPRSVTLRRKDALAMGVRHAFKDARGDLASRLIALGEELKSASLEVPVIYSGPPAELEPGETTELELRLRVPDEIDRSVAWVSSLPSARGDGLTLSLASAKLTSAKGR
jgi:hypothetical protein